MILFQNQNNTTVSGISYRSLHLLNKKVKLIMTLEEINAKLDLLLKEIEDWKPKSDLFLKEIKAWKQPNLKEKETPNV